MSLRGCCLSSWKGHGSGKVPVCWRKVNFTPVIRMVKKDDLGRYRLFSFRPWVDYAANPPGNYFQAHEKGEWKQPVQIYQEQIMHALIAFHNEMSDCVICLDINKAFGTTSGSTVVTKMVRTNWTAQANDKGDENYLDCWTQ